MGMRYHFSRLLANGWIEVHPSPTDRRSKRVFPTTKLLEKLQLLDQGIIEAVELHMKNFEVVAIDQKT